MSLRARLELVSSLVHLFLRGGPNSASTDENADARIPTHHKPLSLALERNKIHKDQLHVEQQEPFQNSESSLRRRGPNATTPEPMTTTKSTVAEVPTAPRPLIRPPHVQFTSLPPPALRSATSSFAAGLEAVLRVVEAQKSVESLERQVHRTKKRLAKARRG